mgnify:CR=1 FL=1
MIIIAIDLNITLKLDLKFRGRNSLRGEVIAIGFDPTLAVSLTQV